MANVALRQFHVLLVDQDDAHRWLLHNVLTALGCGKITTTNSGAEALSFLRHLTRQPPRKRVNAVDFIITDLDMQPLDGLSLLQWIRTSPESPNRFLPAILMGAKLEPVDIKEALGFGASQLMVKPVTVEALAERILLTINRPKQFVYTPNYFGPDRRTARRPIEHDRRLKTELDVKVIRSGLEDLLDTAPKDGVVRYFRPANHLRLKCGLGEGKGEGGFTLGAMDTARREFRSGKKGFVETGLDLVASLSRILTSAAEADDRSEHFRRMHALAKQIGIQGETFGYELLTTIGSSLHRFTGEDVTMDSRDLDLVKAHIDTLTVVLKNDISGDGGEVGRELVTQLRQAIQRISQQAGRQAAQ